jgi:hypothetical protein
LCGRKDTILLYSFQFKLIFHNERAIICCVTNGSDWRR